jgi:hypothetical protein
MRSRKGAGRKRREERELGKGEGDSHFLKWPLSYQSAFWVQGLGTARA